jgi:ketosteroid isomerase-like protein
MAGESVELVRRAFERYSAGDVDGWVACWDAAGEWTPTAAREVEGSARTYRGHAELRKFHAEIEDALAGVTVRASDYREVGETVVVLGELRGRGAASGATFEQEFGWVFEVHDGRIVRGRDYLDQGEALEAAGLPIND